MPESFAVYSCKTQEPMKIAGEYITILCNHEGGIHLWGTKLSAEVDIILHVWKCVLYVAMIVLALICKMDLQCVSSGDITVLY